MRANPPELIYWARNVETGEGRWTEHPEVYYALPGWRIDIYEPVRIEA